MLKEEKNDCFKKFNETKKHLDELLVPILCKEKTRRTIIDDLKKLVKEVGNYTSIDALLNCLDTLKNELNAVYSQKNILKVLVENIHTDISEAINKITIKDLGKKNKTPKELIDYIDHALEALVLINKQNLTFAENMNKVKDQIVQLAKVGSSIQTKLADIEKFITEVLIPELRRRQVSAIDINTIYDRSLSLFNIAKEYTSNFTAENVKMSKTESLPLFFKELLTSDKPLPESSEVQSWEEIKSSLLGLPESTRDVLNNTDNRSVLGKELSRAETELEHVRKELESKKNVEKELQGETSKAFEEIKDNIAKSENIGRNLNLEKAQVGELNIELIRLRSQKEQQQLLNKTKKELNAGLSQGILATEKINKKNLAEAQKTFQHTSDDYKVNQKARIEKEKTLESLQKECQNLQLDLDSFNQIKNQNKGKLEIRNNLEAKYNLLLDNNSLLMKQREEIRS